MLCSPTGKQKTIAATHPNAGVEADYRRRLQALIDEMNTSLLHWIKAAYRASPPEMAEDRTAADEINAALSKLAKRWQGRFDELAPRLARLFAGAATDRADKAFASALRRGGFTVKFKPTPAVKDAYAASVNENVALIKSIASEHLTDVQGMVMRSVAQGRGLETLAKDLRERFDVPRKRAAFIARDQNNKATAVITAARQREIGVTQARWVHSTGGRHPRPSHVKAGKDGLIYDVTKGALIDGEYIFPGQLPNCRCLSRSIIPGFE